MRSVPDQTGLAILVVENALFPLFPRLMQGGGERLNPLCDQRYRGTRRLVLGRRLSAPLVVARMFHSHDEAGMKENSWRGSTFCR